MKRINYVIASTLIFAFLIITAVKYGEYFIGHNSYNESDTQARSVNFQFWEYYNKATDLRVNGNISKAAQRYDSALGLKPDHQNALYYAGNVAFIKSNYQKARTLWKRLLKQDSTSVKAHLRLGTLYACKKFKNEFNPEKAYKHYNAARNLNQEEVAPLIHQARISLLRKDLDQAAALLEKVGRTMPDNAQISLMKGYYNWIEGEKSTAENWLERTKANLKSSKGSFRAYNSESGKGTEESARLITHCNPVIDALEKMDSLKTPTNSIYRQLEKRMSP